MPTISNSNDVDKREMIRSYSVFPTERLRLILDDLMDKLQENIHLENESEVGRSSSSLLINNINIAISSIMYILNRRGDLSTEERKQYLESLPKTSVRLVLNPFRGTNL